MQARGIARTRGSFHAEFVANAEADGAEDGLKGEKARSQASGVSIAKSKSLRKPNTFSVFATLRPTASP
jgi:hypothetical protein